MTPWWQLAAITVIALLVRPWRRRPRPLGAPESVGGGRVDREVARAAPVPSARIRGPAARSRRRRRRRDEAEVVRRLPEMVDLLLLGVGAGLTPRATLARARPFVPAPFGPVIDQALGRADAGGLFADSLERSAAALGPAVRPLVAAVVAGEHEGVELVPALRRVGDDARRRRRAMAEERIRRLPVTMLGPLVLCVLPAFALLTVAPLVLAALADLGIT